MQVKKRRSCQYVY